MGKVLVASIGNVLAVASLMILWRAMSICVAFNLSDGLVMAVDSATTMSDAAGATTKVFLDADKLIQLGTLRVGIATFGVAAIDGRTIGSFIREFSLKTENSDLGGLEIREIVERLRAFFLESYKAFAEKLHGTPFDEIPNEKKGALGLVVGGFLSAEIPVRAVADFHSFTRPAVFRKAVGRTRTNDLCMVCIRASNYKIFKGLRPSADLENNEAI
jgi:hypothetical protein